MGGSLAGVVTIASAIVGLAVITILVTHPQTADIIKAIGENFTAALKAATGQG